MTGKEDGRIGERWTPGKGQIILNILLLRKPLDLWKWYWSKRRLEERGSEKGSWDYGPGVQLHWKKLFCFGISLRDAGYIQELRWSMWMWGNKWRLVGWWDRHLKRIDVSYCAWRDFAELSYPWYSHSRWTHPGDQVCTYHRYRCHMLSLCLPRVNEHCFLSCFFNCQLPWEATAEFHLACCLVMIHVIHEIPSLNL